MRLFIIILLSSVCTLEFVRCQCLLTAGNRGNCDLKIAPKENTQLVTKTASRALLHRSKRYLTFPKGSVLTMSASLSRNIMVRTPRGLRISADCAVPFTLPTDTRSLIYRKGNHKRQRREIIDQLHFAMEGLGFNGTACIRRIICEMRSYIPHKGTSLVKDLLLVTFKFDEELEYMNNCDASIHESCEFSLLEYLEELTSQGSDGYQQL